ncbi:MAG: hypothetical protein AUK47_03585 [Deltaproteobacteria bacterium CG2_30_63_29]|nr:MAG: hypothetical protein AUK47_03585 [Deltaproteobacteria bacterium CG2_30_63_29]
MHSKLTIILLSVLFLAGSQVGCDKAKDKDGDSPKHAPVVDATALPSGLDSLLLGKATLADVTAALSQPTEQIADETLGGDQMVRDNDKPAIRATWRSREWILAEAARDGVSDEVAEQRVATAPGLLSASGPMASIANIDLTFVKLGDGEPVLTDIEITGGRKFKTDLCGFIKDAIGADPEALRCPGSNRSLGDEGETIVYCAGDPAGEHNVFVECSPGREGQGRLNYSLSLN